MRSSLAAAAVFAALCLAASSLHAQSPRPQPSPPLAHDHWAWELLEALDVAGHASAWMTGVRPTSRATARRELERVRDQGFGARHVVDPWAERFDRDFPLGRRDPGGAGGAEGAGGTEGHRREGIEARTGAGFRGGDAFLDRGDDFFGALALSATAGPLSAWGSFERGAYESFDGVREVGLSIPVWRFDAMVGRQRIKAAGPGWTSAQLSGEVPLDGLYVVSNRPMSIPGTKWLLGSAAWHFALAPIHGLDERDRGWIGLGGAIAEPHPRFRIGATRTAQFGGDPDAPMNSERFLRMFFLIQNEPHHLDDHKLELSLRYRWGLFGQPLGTYLVLAQEDSPIWKDPGILLGTSAPVLHSSGLYNLRYEYTAYGRRARWCPGCEYAQGEHGERWQGPWYDHGHFGRYTERGIPVGDALGGYGANHKASLAFWSVDGRTRARGWMFIERREELNLLYERWPGKRRGGGIELGRELTPGMEATVSGLLASGPRIEREWGFQLALHAVFGGER